MKACPWLTIAVWVGLAGCARGPNTPALEASADAERRSGAALLEQKAQAFARAADYARAEQYLNLAIESSGDEARLTPLLIDVCLEDRRYRAALQYAELYLRQHPRSYHLRFVEASLLSALGEVARARQELEKVLVTSPDYADAHYTIAVLLRDQIGNHLEADQHFREYLRLAPGGSHAEEASESLLEVMP